MYSLDTSFFMDWQARYYPLDVFVSLDAKIEAMLAAGELAAAQLVKEEIDAVGPPGLQTWAKNHAGLFTAMTSELQAAGAKIEAAYPDLMDPKGLHESADAYVIALAQLKGGIVVSQETSAAEKRNAKRTHYVPDVCRDLGVSCINKFWLAPVELAWNDGFSPRELNDIRRLVVQHETAIIEVWHEHCGQR